MQICYEPIGQVHCALQERSQTPRFYSLSDIKGQIEIFEQFAPGLKGLERNAHIMVLFHFHQSQDFDLLQKRRDQDEETGVFSLRSPRRPNPIGLSVLKLLGVEGNRLLVDNLDMLDGTPILDIKPYVGLELPEHLKHRSSEPA